MVSILGEYSYEFPKPIKLEKRLKDYLEDDVDEKYYIKDFDSITNINETYSQLNGGKWEKMHDIGRRFYSIESVSPTIHTMGSGNLEPKIITKNISNAIRTGGRGSLDRHQWDLIVVSNLKIRKLTPLECWRLMGIADTDFIKAEKVCSNSQLYKQAGNGIVVNVFAAIVKNLV